MSYTSLHADQQKQPAAECQQCACRGHEKEDAAIFAAWGVDYLKYDNCNAPASDNVQERYRAMSRALEGTGITFAMCSWGVGDPWLWADQVCAFVASCCS